MLKKVLVKILGYLRTYWLVIIFFSSIFLVFIPFCINMAFKFDSGITFLQAEWHAEDALNFYGAILASGLGIVGVFISIQYAQKSYRQDEKNRVKPYMALTYLHEKNNVDLLALLGYAQEKEAPPLKMEFDGETQYRLSSVAIILKDGKVLYQSELSKPQEQLVRQGGVVNINGKIVQKQYISMALQVDNVGMGAATKCRVAFYEEGKTARGIFFHTVKCGDTIYCHIFSEEPESCFDKQYFLKFKYFDILETEYTQTYNITFTVDPATNRIAHNIQLNGEQKEESIWNI